MFQSLLVSLYTVGQEWAWVWILPLVYKHRRDAIGDLLSDFSKIILPFGRGLETKESDLMGVKEVPEERELIFLQKSWIWTNSNYQDQMIVCPLNSSSIN